jgi:hypothetical protein
VNYGHRLEFGAVLAPTAGSPDAVVSLAQRCERLGYDLVAVPDSPHEADLDAWTLLAWVAGRTQRVRLVANVTNPALRPPSVLARAAASLDLLSGGRLEVGLGAARADEAMGGRRLSADQQVEAFAEAIEVLRGLWDVNQPTPLTYAGAHHQVPSARRGPAPAHDIPVWLQAVEPGMLRLVGHQADAWHVALDALPPEELRACHKVIDEAAEEAGRDPREIRRLVTLTDRFVGLAERSGKRCVEELLRLVVDDGIGTFLVAADAPEVLERFAGEVAPALREAVERELPGVLSAPRLRRAEVRAKRLPGINYDAVPASLADAVIEPGDPGYVRVKSTYLRGGAPGLVLQPRTVEQVVDALAFARTHPHLPLSLRSAGHGISGRSTNHGGLVLDVSKLNTIEVLDTATRRVRIGPGARWMDVAAALSPYRWALTSGDYGGVGVGGLATAGGIGFLGRAHGLTLDHIRAVEMVLADGSLVRASEEENADLFWAVRGAGANFGIVTSFEFEVDEVGDVGWGQFLFDASDTATLLRRWGEIQEAAPRDLTSFLVLAPRRRGQPPIAQLMAMVASDQTEVILDRLEPLARVGPLYDHTVVLAPYAAIMANARGEAHDGRGEPVTRSAFVDHMTPEFAEAAARFLHSGATYFFQFRAVGGAIADVPPDATAYAHRSTAFSVTAFGFDRRRLDQAWDQMSGHFHGLYLNFETDPRPERLNDAFPPRTLARLREIKARYDPDNVFRDNFNITPAPPTTISRRERGERA